MCAYSTINEKVVGSTNVNERKILASDVNQIRQVIQTGEKDLKTKNVSLLGNTITADNGANWIRRNGNTFQFHNGTSWQEPSTDTLLTFTAGENIAARDVVYLKVSDGKIYKASTANNDWIGIATAAITSGASGTVYPNGSLVGGFSGLTSGTWYKVNASAGTIDASDLSITNTQYNVGVAISATQIILIKNQLNGITNTINITGVPVGSYFPMLTLGVGQTTSTTTNQLIDSAATFTDDYIGKQVFLGNEVDSTNYSQNNGTWTLKKTWVLDATENVGLVVPRITNGLWKGQCYYKLYYTDSTNDVTNTAMSGDGSRISANYINPEPLKKVWKIELWLRYYSSIFDLGQANNHRIYFNESATVISRTSTSTLVLDKDIFLYTGSNYQFMNFAPGLYEPCDGTTVENTESHIFGLTKPTIANNFIRVL